MRATVPTVVAALAAAAVLAGCSPSGPPAPSVTGGTSAVDDLTIDECPPGSGRLTSTGSLQNSEGDAGDYLVRVSWLDTDGSVIASAWQEIEAVDAGASADWSVAVDLGEASASSCTVALTRGVL